MEKTVRVAPSILSADFSKLGKELKSVTEAGADMIHIDVMDGHFVPNITIGPVVVKSVRKKTKLPFDVHLMIEKPQDYIKRFLEAGADIITFHIEARDDTPLLIKAIKMEGRKVGIAISPKTPFSRISRYLPDIDKVLIMSVEPGFAGQHFLDRALPKIRNSRSVFNGDIQVDGGITPATARSAVKAGANILVAGTAIFGGKDYAEEIRRLKGE